MILARTAHACRWLLPVLLVAACGDNSSPKQAGTNTNGVTSAYDTLQSALADCGQQASRCASDAGMDTAAHDTCGEQLASCRENAGKAASNAFVDAIHAC